MELSTPSCSTTLLWIKKIGKAQLELPKEMDGGRLDPYCR